MPNNLTPSQTKALERCEQIIERGKETFVEVGLALMEIRDNRLYAHDYDTFQAYCEQRWQFTRQRAYQLIEAAEVTVQMSTTVDKETSKTQEKREIPSERVARELAKVPEEKRVEVLEKASTDGPPTAAKVKAAYPPPPPPPPKSSFPPPPSQVVVDKIGRAVPEPLLPMWERAREAQELLSAISGVKCAVEHAQDDKDKLFAEVNYSSVLGHLLNAYAQLKVAVPYAVCPSCQGKVYKTCTACCGRGLVSEHRWKTAFPKELTAMVLKSVGK